MFIIISEMFYDNAEAQVYVVFISSRLLKHRLFLLMLNAHHQLSAQVFTSTINTCTPSCCQATKAPTELRVHACHNIKKSKSAQ